MILFSLLEETLAPLLVTEDVAEVLNPQIIIANAIQEFFIMSEYIFDGRRGVFANSIMGLTETGKVDAVPVSKISLFNFMVN